MIIIIVIITIIIRRAFGRAVRNHLGPPRESFVVKFHSDDRSHISRASDSPPEENARRPAGLAHTLAVGGTSAAMQLAVKPKGAFSADSPGGGPRRPPLRERERATRIVCRHSEFAERRGPPQSSR